MFFPAFRRGTPGPQSSFGANSPSNIFECVRHLIVFRYSLKKKSLDVLANMLTLPHRGRKGPFPTHKRKSLQKKSRILIFCVFPYISKRHPWDPRCIWAVNSAWIISHIYIYIYIYMYIYIYIYSWSICQGVIGKEW